MKRSYGFTLVELLVVIAIISILAGIVIPNVPKFINKARATRAHAEIKGIDLALTKMLTDAGRSDFRSGFFSVWPASSGPPINESDPQLAVAAQANLYSTVFYVLLRKGKYAPDDPSWPGAVQLDPEVQRKLGDQYMDIGNDPWGALYHFYAGPFSPAVDNDGYYVAGGRVLVPFRSYQITDNVPGGIQPDALTLSNVDDPDSDTVETLVLGYPAPRKSTHFVWSNGKNRRSNQEFDEGYAGNPADVGMDFIGGGDDINSWDGDQSWMTFYN